MRYIPTFRFPVSGFFVNTSGNVIKRPPSCGQHFRIGKSKRLTSVPFCMTSLQGPDFTFFGKNDPSSASFGSILTMSKNPCGVSIFRNPWMRCATSSSPFTSNASAIRRTLPNALINKGYRDPFGFSNSSAGLPPGGTGIPACPLCPPCSPCPPCPLCPPCLPRMTRCTTSAISNTGSTSARIRFSSPSFSSFPTNSRKSRYATSFLPGSHAVRGGRPKRGLYHEGVATLNLTLNSTPTHLYAVRSPLSEVGKPVRCNACLLQI